MSRYRGRLGLLLGTPAYGPQHRRRRRPHVRDRAAVGVGIV